MKRVSASRILDKAAGGFDWVMFMGAVYALYELNCSMLLIHTWRLLSSIAFAS